MQVKPETDLIEREVMKNEKSRSLFLAILFLLFAFLYVLFSFILSENYEKRFQGRLPRWHFPLFFLLVSGFEFISFYFFTHSNHKNPISAKIVRYLLAGFEIVIPTVSIFLLSRVVDPLEALLGPPSFLYFLFILTGILSMNFRLSLLQGFLAGLQFFILGQFFARGSVGSDGLSHFVQGTFLPKSMLYFFSGIGTGFVAHEFRKRIHIPAPEQENVTPLQQRLLISFRGEDRLIPYDSIDYISAAGRKTLIHTSEGDFETNVFIGDIAAGLHSPDFIRVHRSFIVPVQKIDRLERAGKEYIIRLYNDAETLPVSRRRLKDLKQAMESSRHS